MLPPAAQSPSSTLPPALRSGSAGLRPTTRLRRSSSACCYDLLEQRSRRREHYGRYAPVIESEAQAFPPRTENLAEQVKRSWADVVGHCRAAATRERLNDPHWVVRHGDQPHKYAETAISAYVVLADEWRDLSMAETLTRALELALSLNDCGSLSLQNCHFCHALQPSSNSPEPSRRTQNLSP